MLTYKGSRIKGMRGRKVAADMCNAEGRYGKRRPRQFENEWGPEIPSGAD